MSTDTQEWTEERIADWRAYAEDTRLLAMGVPLSMDRNVLLSLLDALEHERERAAGLSDAFNDVMDALDAALDDGAEYGERPAEVVWRLRDQRDEAREELERERIRSQEETAALRSMVERLRKLASLWQTTDDAEIAADSARLGCADDLTEVLDDFTQAG